MNPWTGVAAPPEQDDRLHRAIEALLSPCPKALRERYPEALFAMESDKATLADCGLTESDALLLTAVPRLARHAAREKFGEVPCLNARQAAAEYLRSYYIGVHAERFYAFYLDGGGCLIEADLLQEGTDHSAAFRMKKMLSGAIERDAYAVIMSHNHPRGTTQASKEDIMCTLQALRLMPATGILLLDHIIIAGGEAVFLRDASVIPESLWQMQNPADPLNSHWIR